jgi:hypothetical protein
LVHKKECSFLKVLVGTHRKNVTFKSSQLPFGLSEVVLLACRTIFACSKEPSVLRHVKGLFLDKHFALMLELAVSLAATEEHKELALFTRSLLGLLFEMKAQIVAKSFQTGHSKRLRSFSSVQHAITLAFSMTFWSRKVIYSICNLISQARGVIQLVLC